MDHAHHGTSLAVAGHTPGHESLNRTAFVATLHCLSGCAIGEVAGLVAGRMLGWGNGATLALAVALAFLFGFALTALPFLRRGYSFQAAFRIALAADAVSIAVMEVVDNAVMLLVPGAMDAALDSTHFWASMAVSLLMGGAAAYPVNRWLLSRGKGHAVAHAQH